MDFGLAKPVVLAFAVANAGNYASTTSATSPAATTEQGTVIGTFQYIAPEVLQGEPADARSDIFSFGCVLSQMIARPAHLRCPESHLADGRHPRKTSRAAGHDQPRHASRTRCHRRQVPRQESRTALAECRRSRPRPFMGPTIDTNRHREAASHPSDSSRPCRLCSHHDRRPFAAFSSVAKEAHPPASYSIVLPSFAPVAPASLMPLGVGRPSVAVSLSGEQICTWLRSAKANSSFCAPTMPRRRAHCPEPKAHIRLSSRRTKNR